MKVAFFDAHRFERPVFDAANARHGHALSYFETRLSAATAGLARGSLAVCSFVNDRLDAQALEILAREGVRFVALRSAGFNHVDLGAAARLGFRVARVPAYSPHAVAEHAMGLILALNRKLCRAHSRVRELNFSLDGLVGFDLHGKTVGVVGTGRIGAVFARIVRGFGCRVVAYDPAPDAALEKEGVEYAPLDQLFERSDILSLHVPLTPETRHLVDRDSIGKMKAGVMIVNTGRGGLIETGALVSGLKSGRIGSAALDVYEEEEKFFFQDLSDQVLQDDVLARLLTFPNVLITAHQAFLTREALEAIAETTLSNLDAFEKGSPCPAEVSSASAR